LTEDRRLRDKLAKLAAEETGSGERRLSASGTDLARAIIEEIDETILARRLTFRAADGATLALEVANRRLLGLLEAPQDLVSPEHRDRLFTQLPPDDEAALAAVAETLRRFAEGCDGLAVSAAPLGRAIGSGMLGRSAAAVARALGIDLYDRPAAPAAPDPAQGFAAGLARLALAVAEISDGQPAPATGRDADATDRLSCLDAAAIAALEGELGAGAAGAGRFLMLSGTEEALFLGRKADGRAVAALLPVDHAGAVAALWRATGGA
jgi:hypothetical protein